MKLTAATTSDLNCGVERSLFKPGHNCMCVSEAESVRVLVDAADYYKDLSTTIVEATRLIHIVGWDFDGRIRLRPDEADSLRLGQQLRQMVDARPDLNIQILVWSLAVVHASSGAKQLLFGETWQDHPRITIKLDKHHPIYASHHQKIVTIDDRIAYCGGVDLTIGRWDTHQHLANNGLRCNPEGVAYNPVHDVQMRIDGPAAAELAAIASARWQQANGSFEYTPPPIDTRKLYPARLPTPGIHRVAISRTAPATRSSPAVQEVARLTEDLLLSARQHVYIENQYFCSSVLRPVLGQLLQRPDGPQIVVVTGQKVEGFVERWIMGKNRRRLIRWLRSIDVHDRFRIYYPTVADSEGPCEVLVHSKVMIIDQLYLRIGSANMNNRSMGLDTECDLVLRADEERGRKLVSGVRDQLLAEHLGISQEDMCAAVARRGLIGAIESFKLHQRRLNPFDTGKSNGLTGNVFGTSILDPLKRIL